MLRLALRVLSPAGAGGRLSTLIFHRVLPGPDPLFPAEVDAARFRQICTWARQWFQVLPLDAAVQRLREGTLPARAMAITFDDGYADNHDIALPILRDLGLPATFFIATGFLDGGRMWNDTLVESVRRTNHSHWDLTEAGLSGIGTVPLNDLGQRRTAISQLIQACRYLPQPEREAAVQQVAQTSGARLPNDLMMTTEQLRGMRRAGMGLGGHTVSHPILARLPPDQARQEIEGGKQQLQNKLQTEIRLFAYPNGRPEEDFRAEHVKMVQAAGFDAAVSTAWGASGSRSDLYQLPRFTPWDRARALFGFRLCRNLNAPVHVTQT